MSANLEKVGEKTSLYLYKQPAWHGTGTVVQEAKESKEVIVIAGMDYGVSKIPIAGDSDTGWIEYEKHKMVIRDDTNTALGVVGKDYTLIQNQQAFDFFDDLVGEGAVTYESAGVLGKGERIWVSAKLPNHFKINGDEIDNFLFFTNGHDGTIACNIGFTPVRIVCQNTLQMALKGAKQKITIRHTKNAKERLDEAHRILGITNSLVTEAEEIFNAMSKIKITDKEATQFIARSFAINKELTEQAEVQLALQERRANNKIDAIFEYYQSDPTQQTKAVKGTLFGVYNSVIGHLNHQEFDNPEKRLDSIMFGYGKAVSQRSFKLAMDMI